MGKGLSAKNAEQLVEAIKKRDVTIKELVGFLQEFYDAIKNHSAVAIEYDRFEKLLSKYSPEKH